MIVMGAFNGYSNALVPKSEMGRNRDLPGYVPIFVNIGAFFLIATGTYMCLRVRENLKRTMAFH